MAWTYSGNPASSARDEVRFILGDIDTNAQELTDEEIDYMLTKYSSVISQSVLGLFDVLLLRYGRIVSESVGSVSIQYNQRYQSFLEMRKIFIAQNNLTDAVPYAGGISIGDKARNSGRADGVIPSMRRGLHDSPQGPDEGR